jgi:hypothetical protein
MYTFGNNNFLIKGSNLNGESGTGSYNNLNTPTLIVSSQQDRSFTMFVFATTFYSVQVFTREELLLPNCNKNNQFSINVCNGHGICVIDTCECDYGWSVKIKLFK